jgi:phosphate transport system protein
MLRKTFDRDLQHLQDEVLTLGSMVRKAILESVEALKQRDQKTAHRLMADDRFVNEKRFAIESETLTLIATQQPLAGDLRTLAAVLEIATELERMGDYAKGIAKINIMMGNETPLKPLIDIPKMADKAMDMLDRALVAFNDRDVAAARAIPLEDNEVDALYNQVYRELLTFIMADPTTLNQATYLLWAAHNLERAADRVTNICERVVFTVTGKMQEMDVEDGAEQMNEV